VVLNAKNWYLRIVPMFIAILRLVYTLIEWIQPFLVPICFVLAWGVMGMAALSIWSTARAAADNAYRMHQIPCTSCQFYTGDYRLKCTVHPQSALSERAIDCRDYEARNL